MPRPDTVHRPTKLASLQALRGVAALGVVLFHLLHFEPSYLPGIAIAPAAFTVGRAGVDLFFVLSGLTSLFKIPGGINIFRNVKWCIRPVQSNAGFGNFSST